MVPTENIGSISDSYRKHIGIMSESLKAILGEGAEIGLFENGGVLGKILIFIGRNF